MEASIARAMPHESRQPMNGKECTSLSEFVYRRPPTNNTCKCPQALSYKVASDEAAMRGSNEAGIDRELCIRPRVEGAKGSALHAVFYLFHSARRLALHVRGHECMQ